MPETKITASAVKDLIKFYASLPAATFFKGLTGYGFRIKDDVEGIGEITYDSQILHPAYIFITSGIAKGRKTIKAEDITSAVEFFQKNPLAAVLRVTTSRGFKMDSGMPVLCDALESESQTIFEITHYGGRSISPMLIQEIGKVSDPEIKWQSGFEYKNVRQNEHLTLIRHLIESDWESQKGLDRVWDDFQKEVSRLMFFHCEDKLRYNLEKQNKSAKIFLSQELNQYLDGSGKIQLPRGYQHEIRDDGVVIIKKSLANAPGDEAGFEEAIKEFNKVCFQAFSLYCQPLGDNPKVGQPQNEVFDLAEIAKIEFERDERRSSETEERLIGWFNRVPVFPQNEWNPNKKSYRVLLHRWGRGLRATPAPAHYEDRFAQKDANIGSLQVVRVEFDGQEKVVEEEEFVFETKTDFSRGEWFSVALVPKNSGSEFEIEQIQKDYTQHMRQYINGNGKLDWMCVSQDVNAHKRTVPATDVWLKAPEYHYDQYAKLDLSCTLWQIRGKGIGPEGNKAEAYMKNPNPPESGDKSIFQWEEIPLAIRQEHEKRYQVCACGRARYDSENASQCHNCANYRHCARCGQETYFGKEKIEQAEKTGIALLCPKCEKLEEQENLVSMLSKGELEEIEKEAKILLGSQIREEGSEWIYENEEAVYSSKLTPEFLEQVLKISSVEPEKRTELIKQVYETQRISESMIENLKYKLSNDIFVLSEFVSSSEAVIKQAKEKVVCLEKELSDFGTKPEFTEELNYINELYKRAKEELNVLDNGLRLRHDYSIALKKALAGLEKMEEIKQIEPPKGSQFSYTHYRTSHKPGWNVYVIKQDGTLLDGRKEFPSNRQRRLERKFTEIWDFVPESAVIIIESRGEGKSQTVGELEFRQSPVELTEEQLEKLNELFGEQRVNQWLTRAKNDNMLQGQYNIQDLVNKFNNR